MALGIVDGVKRGLERTIRTIGPNPALTGGLQGYGLSPVRFVSGPDWYPRTASGVTVTSESALTLSSVYASVRLLATTAAGLPIHVYQESLGEPERVSTPETAYLWGEPNNEMTAQSYWETVIGHEVFEGDAFIFVVKNQRGDVVVEGDSDFWGLWYIEPWRVQVGRASDGRKVYLVDNEQVMLDFKAGGEIIHVPNWARGPLRGVSPLTLARGAIALASQSQEYAERFFSQDSTPRGVLSTDQNLTQEQADALSVAWERNNSGASRTHKTAVVANGAKFQAISVSPEDAQLLDERRFQLSDIARFFGIPPHMLGDTEKSTSWGTGIEEQTRGFLTYTLQAHINRIEQAIDSALLRRSKTRRYVKFELGGLLRPNQKEQMDILERSVRGGIRTPNEARKLLDLPPLEGGDVLLQQVNMAPLGQLGASGENPSGLIPPGVEAQVQQLALNGAQIASLLEVIAQVTGDMLAADTAEQLLVVAFPALTQAQIHSLVQSAVAFTPPPAGGGQ